MVGKICLWCVHETKKWLSDCGLLCGVCSELWEYLASLSIEMNRLTDSIREDPEKIGIHLKTAPEKRYHALDTITALMHKSKAAYYTSLLYTAQHCTMLHHIALHCCTRHNTALYYTTLHFTTVHSTTLHVAVYT